MVNLSPFSGSAIPESSTYAVLAGLSGCLAAALKRQRQHGSEISKCVALALATADLALPSGYQPAISGPPKPNRGDARPELVEWDQSPLTNKDSSLDESNSGQPLWVRGMAQSIWFLRIQRPEAFWSTL